MMGKALSGELSCPCDRSCFSLKPYVVTPHLNRLVETVQMRGHNMYTHIFPTENPQFLGFVKFDFIGHHNSSHRTTTSQETHFKDMQYFRAPDS